MERRECEGTLVIPVLVSLVAGWQTFKLGKFELGDLQSLPKNGKFVTDRRYWKNQNEAFVTIAEELTEEITNLSGELP